MCRPLFDVLWEVENRITMVPHWLICTGYDGTLTPIVDDPSAAYLSPQMERVLLSLAGNERVSLAILSGRERSDLQTRVGIPGLIYAGNHGLEISGPGFLFVEPMASTYRAELQNLAADLTARLQPLAGVLVEDKGLTITVHERQALAPEREQVRREVRAALAKSKRPFLLTTDDKVFEIRPRVYWDKGTAVFCIKAQYGQPGTAVIYLGDDATDEDAFEALADEITIQVDGGPETSAHYRLESPVEVRKFLEWLDDHLHRSALHAMEAALV